MAARASAEVWPPREKVRRILSLLTSARRHRFPRLPISASPNRILALRLKGKLSEYQRLRYAGIYRLAARRRDERLPLLTTQTLLQRAIFPGEEAIAMELGPSHSPEWLDRLRTLTSRGYTDEDLDHWVWILSAEDGDSRVERLFSTERRKPPFLIFLLLRKDERIYRAETLVALMKYISEQYCRPQPKAPSDQNGTDHARRPLRIQVEEFVIILGRLVHHVQRVWPRSIVTVARLAADYIRNTPAISRYRKLRRNHWASRCLIFNKALQLFRKPATDKPILHMEFNWRAQKVLLATSENLERRLTITRRSFQAIRQVIIALKKSDEEKAVARRFTKTWPPYRQDFDGRDALRTLDDDYSRSVKAGNLMTQEGYPDNDYDRALSSLGGTSDESPTVQTRSLAPKEWTGDKQPWNFFSLWAMKVRATRTINEAWMVFTGFSAERPNFQVYGEMFLKLQAREMVSEGDVLPGDARETLPIHRGSYSEYELARQSPPTVAELYDEMISRGVPPEGNCLLTLVRNAQTVEEGLRYLYDSPVVDNVSVKSLGLFKVPSHQVLRRIPLLVFNSYIQLLCRLQPDRRGQLKFQTDELYRIRHAIELIKLRLEPTTTEGATFRPPWHAVFRALARPYICLSNQTRGNMDAEALATSTTLLPYVLKTVGMDPDIFMYYCRAVQKTAATQLGLESRASENPYSAQSAAAAEVAGGRGRALPPLVPGRAALLRSIGGFFATLTTPVRVTGSLDFLPPLRHTIGPAHLHTHMRTLAFLEDPGAMAGAMRWMLRNWAHVDAEAERLGPRGPRLVARTICAFRAFAFVSNTYNPNPNPNPSAANNNNNNEDENNISDDNDNYTNNYGPEMAAELDKLMDEASAKTCGAWRWPTPAEVDFYIQSDQRGHSQLLQQRVLMRRQQQGERMSQADQRDLAAGDDYIW